MDYDSKADTLEHMKNVNQKLIIMVQDILRRGLLHDKSKLESSEKPYFDEWTPKLSGVTYGTDEYRDMLKQMKPAIDHHQRTNRHHPEYHERGIDGMTLVDIVEMFCDWKAATLRHDDGDLSKSIEINKKRFGMSDQLVNIFINTKDSLCW